MSDGRRYDDGDEIKLSSGRIFEVTAVSYQEVDGKKSRFAYTIRDQEELQAERAEQKRLEAEAKKAEEAAAKAAEQTAEA